MFERVLTATDMLDACDAPVIIALEVAKQNQGKLFVLHVLEPSYFHECGPVESVKHFKTGEEIAASPEYKEVVKAELDKKCAGALKPYGHYQIDISYGKPSIEIRRWSRKVGADLIVLGPHAGKIEEENALIGIPIGNTVEDVIMNTTIPVMIIGRLLPKEKLNYYLEHDPLKIGKKYLFQAGYTEDKISEIEREVNIEIEQAIEFAKASEEMSEVEFLQFVEEY